MQWQDWVFSVAGWIFAISLIPTIRGKQKPELSTSIISTIVLFAISFAYFTLGLRLSAISTCATASGWVILAYQRFKQPKK